MPTYHRDADNGTPWYVTAAYKLGIPTIIAGFLVWFLVTKVDNSLGQISGALTTHANATVEMSKDIKDWKGLQERETSQLNTLINLLRVECLVSARETGSNRQDCLK